MDVQQRKTRVAALSVFSNTFLTLMKLVIGLLIGSVSVISEAIHSGVDLLASAIALFAVKTADKPADEGHPFGHGKVENISGTVEALLIFVAAGWIIYEAIKKLMKPEPLEHLGLGVLIMFISAVMNFIVSHYLFKVSRETGSVALEADGWHLRTDVYTSAGVMAGLGLITVGEWLSQRNGWDMHFPWLDPLAALIVAGLIIHAAYELTVKAAVDLLDASLPVEEEAWIRAHIREMKAPVRGFHRLRTRKSGPRRFVDLHLLVDSLMTVEDSHAIAEQLSDAIEARYPGTSVTVHVEPCESPCKPGCKEGCLLSEEERESLSAMQHS